LGYVEGQNLVLERRSAEARFERFETVHHQGRTPSLCPLLVGADIRPKRADFSLCRVGPGNFTPSLSQIRT
jgi:hypothetical protein